MDYSSLAAADVVIVGAGAAGLATALFCRRGHPHLDVLLVDGAARPGAKILVSGGGRCNVTNAQVRDTDFWGGRRTIVRRVLRALTVAQTIDLFADLGVPLREEPGGKLFPVSNRARDVLDALLNGVSRAGVRLAPATRVTAISRVDDGFALHTPRGDIQAGVVVLATGGRSLPKTGSDGAGYDIARSLGHSIVPETPALVPLVLEEEASIHRDLSGVSLDGEIAIWIDGAVALRLAGALLWTHFGVSGPVVLNASRHWARARLEGRDVQLTLNARPGSSFEQEDRALLAAAAERPRAGVRSALGPLPDAFVQALLRAADIPLDRALAELSRDERRRLVRAITEWPLAVRDTRGYNFAEVTAGGVDLGEIDPATMASRVCPGLFLVGEILDVDGRIGGFNFQWAWASARAAADGIARAWDARGRIRTAPAG